MNIGSFVASSFIFIGFIGLLLVVFLCVFLKIHELFCKRYIVYWKDLEGDKQWTPVKKVCTEWGAIRIVLKKSNVKKIIKVVRQYD